MSKLIVVSGAAGSGKGTVLGELFKMSDNLRYSISFTTRKPRPGEQNGVNYFFVTRRQFASRVRKGDFVEHVEYCGNCYGTSRSYINSLIEKGFDVILEIETVGALKVMEAMPDCVSVFLAPPDYRVLEARLRGRGTESEEDVIKRLARAREEILIAEKYGYIVVNHDGQAQKAAEAILDICRGISPDSSISHYTNAQKQEFIKSFMSIQEDSEK